MPRTRRSSLQLARQALRSATRADRAARRRRRPARSGRSRPCAARDRSSNAPQRSARDECLPSITTEMLRSEAPCAIARTLTAAVPSAPNTFAATPCEPAMPSPTTARMLQPGSTSTLWIWPCAQLAVERLAHDGFGARGFRFGNREADRMLGAALRDQDHRDAVIAQRAEQAMRRAGHADHAGAFQVHQRDAIDAGDALDRDLRRRLRADQRAGLLRREGVADPDRNALAAPPAPSSADGSPWRRSTRAPSPRCRTANR